MKSSDLRISEFSNTQSDKSNMIEFQHVEKLH